MHALIEIMGKAQTEITRLDNKRREMNRIKGSGILFWACNF
jgi:hypothetical protein